MSRIYLGDSVYAQLESETGMVLLYTDNGFGADNKIYLEESVIEALVSYLKIVLEGPEPANDR